MPYCVGAALGVTYGQFVVRRYRRPIARVPLGAAVYLANPEQTAGATERWPQPVKKRESDSAPRIQRPKENGRSRPAGLGTPDPASTAVANHSAAATTAMAGKEKKNVAPCPSHDSTHIRPPYRSTTRLQIGRPMPVPGIDRSCSRLNTSKIC